MVEKGDKIKDLFSSKLGNFEPEIPTSVWGGIDQLLSELPPPVAPETVAPTTEATSAVGKIAIVKATLLATAVAASVGLGIFLVSKSDAPEMMPTTEKKEHPIDKEPIEENILQPESVIQEQLFVEANTSSVVSSPRQIIAIKSVETSKDPIEEVSVYTETNSKIREIPHSEEQIEIEVESEKPKEEEVKKEEEAPPLPLPKFMKEDLSLGVKFGGGALTQDVDKQGGDLLFSRAQRGKEFVNLLDAENEDYELTHKQPISIGLTVSKQLSQKFSIETGLMFTYLSSKIKSSSATNIREKQEFGYLGIPIYLNYDILNFGKGKIYLSLGFMAQKDVYGKYSSSVGLLEAKELLELEGNRLIIPDYVLYSEPAHIKKNISQSHWQLSTQLSLGVSWPLYRRLRVYGTIGGAYYFDAKNEYRTVYSDRDFQLDLNLGLRFDF